MTVEINDAQEVARGLEEEFRPMTQEGKRGLLPPAGGSASAEAPLADAAMGSAESPQRQTKLGIALRDLKKVTKGGACLRCDREDRGVALGVSHASFCSRCRKTKVRSVRNREREQM